jgi:hypothetical protein
MIKRRFTRIYINLTALYRQQNEDLSSRAAQRSHLITVTRINEWSTK